MINGVKELWAADADPLLIAPLLSFFPNHIKVGTSQSLAFSSQLDVISPESVYDKIDYKEQELTGEELYTLTSEALAAGFKGGQQYTEAQITLMMAHYRTIHTEVLP